MSNLPKGWSLMTVGDVCEAVEKHKPSDSPRAEFTYIDISSIDNSRNTIVDPRVLSGADAPSRARQILRAGDTVLSTVRTYLRNTAIVPEDLDGATGSTGFSVLRPRRDLIEPRYLFYRALESVWVESLSAQQTGSSYPAVREADVRAMPIEVPPLDEQRRIVEAIEIHLSHLDAGVESLRRAKRNLERMRAVSIDRLFEDERLEWVTLGEVARIESRLVDPASHLSMPHVAPNHIESRTGRLLPYRTVGEDGVVSGKYLFKEGDVLYSKIRPYLAKAVVAERSGLCSADMYPLSTDLAPRFLQLWLISPRFTAAAATRQGRSVLPKINREALFKLSAPAASKEVQLELLSNFDRQWSLLDATESAIAASEKRASRVRASVLSAAFSGRLGSAGGSVAA